ncbi:FMRFamide receptor [Biomphalaria pfeifferi]|uniref:FMRFamide receptor n=1 Tax=Biomphalaria pfeifferi TaxID=112525 RepID=A0AAD8BI07_BIOPF|nr:FMRFamide receptor [Biomphalaria pfeifferi]
MSMNTTAEFGQHASVEPLLVDCRIVVLNVICGEVVGLLVIVANSISIVVFCKLGFHDSVDVKLTALAISDIGSLVSPQFYYVMINPWVSSVQPPFEISDAILLLSLYPHIYFIRVSGLITAFAALERKPQNLRHSILALSS